MAIEKRYQAKRDAAGTIIRDSAGEPVEDRRQPRYRVRIHATDPVTGKRQNKTIGTYRTRREAEAAEREAVTRHERGTLVDPARVTVAELVSKWQAAKAGTVTPNSLTDYEIAIRRHILPALGSAQVQKLTPGTIQEQFNAWQAAGVKPRTLARVHSILSQALTYGLEVEQCVYRNIMDAVKRPSLTRRAATVWTPEQVWTFLDSAMNRPILTRAGDSGKTRPDELSPLWHFLALEGMRRGEALGLRWQDVNWQRGTIHIAQTVVADRSNRGRAIVQPRAKTAAGSRSVKLTADTLAVLRDHHDRQAFARRAAGSAWQDYDLIVCTSTGTPINPNNVTRSFQRLVMLAGLPEIRVHDLRHSAATILLRAGEPAKIVSERLGHANIGITLDTYSHVLPDMQGQAAEAMSRIMAEAKVRTAQERETITEDAGTA